MKDILQKKTLLAMVIASFWAESANAVSVKHHFDAIVGIFNAGEADFTYDVDSKKYAVYSNIYTKGLFDTLYPFTAKYATSGRIENNQMRTENYSYESQSRFNKRTKKVVYNSDGVPLKSISTKNGKRKVKPITIKEDIDNTTDLQSVMAAMARQYLTTDSCDGMQKVFDGKRRYNIARVKVGDTPLGEMTVYTTKIEVKK